MWAMRSEGAMLYNMTHIRPSSIMQDFMFVFPGLFLDVQMYYPCTWSVACVIRKLVQDEMRTFSLLSVNDTTE